MAETPKSPYLLGYEAALIPPPEQPNCPFPKDTPEERKWWEGFGDSTDELFRWNGGEFD